MSNSIVIEVLRHVKGLSHATKHVLLAIACYVEEHGQGAFPSQATLAADSGVTDRYIEACVQECETAGYLSVIRRRDPGKRPRNFYTLLYPWRTQTIPEIASGNQHRGNQIRETRSGNSAALEPQDKDLDLQGKPEPRTPIPEPASPIHNDDETYQKGLALMPPALAAIAQGGLPPSPVVTPPPPKLRLVSTKKRTKVPPPPDADFDPTVWYLGDLCPGQHEYKQTGMTLKKRKGNKCPQCQAAWLREYRQKRQAQE